MIFRFYLFIIFLLATSPIKATIEKPTDEPTVINFVNIHGNRLTKEHLIRIFLDIDSGTAVDSTILQNAKQRLMATRLFTKVAVFPLQKSDGVHLYVIVTERFYFTPDAGGNYYRYKYGKEDLWFRLNFSVDHKNFRGMGEKLKVSVGLWDWRNISLSWSKPFPPSGYYFTIGAAADFYPNQVKKINHVLYSGKVIVGKELTNTMTVGIGLLPLIVNQKSIIDATELHTSELYSLIGFQSDFRDHAFNTSNGWYLYTDIKNNHLYHSNSPGYLQLNTSYKIFHRGIFPENTMAWRIETSLRNKNAGSIHNLGLGGTKTIRGYLQPIIGGGINGNNTLLLSCEYRFPIFGLPLLTIPVLTFVSSRFESLDIRVHGALIADYGRVSETTTDLLSVSSDGTESGTGIGAGIRILLPDLETNGCIDVVFAEDYRAPRGKIRFFSVPTLHLYLNFPY